ncbi:MAG: PEFG-CTERM sorting domain-containing protein, partial [Nitrosopumilales archaeon]|nr:PEFG-CTERM sorting domain-containing protein [Nitrosopumilales archaeon]
MRSHKGSITIVSLTLLVILSPIFLHQAFAAEQGMTLMATANAGSNTISISGHTANPSNEVSIVVTSPNGNIVTIDQVTPNANGDYATTIQTNSALWKQDGFYKITAQQSSALMYTLSVQVEISGGTTAETSVSQSSLDGLVTGGVAPTALRGLTMEVDAGGIRVAISGHTDRTNTDVTIVVKAPNGNIVTIDQVTPNANGDFATTIQTNSALWKQDGFYTVSAQQVGINGYSASAQVEIADGAVIPEFGTIAVMILAVAIISIIAVSARSRLNVLPK